MTTEGGEGGSQVFLREHSIQREQSFNSCEAATSLLCSRREVQFDLNKDNEEDFYEMRPETKGDLIL